jgi:hypothetical protein
MTPGDRDLIFSLVSLPGQPSAGSPEGILHHFVTNDGHALGLRLLREAIDLESADDVEAALIVCGAFGVGEEHVDLLSDLLNKDWHEQHENIVSLLDRVSSPKAVEALRHAAEWVPGYLDYDDSRALAVKALWALGDTPGAAAENALLLLSRSDSEVVRTAAEHQLLRRSS